MPWYFAVVEDRHELQNPTSRDKILLLGERLGLGPESHILDVASGRGGPAVLLAGTYGCRITCIEKAEEFDAVARRRVHEAGLDHLIELVHADAREVSLEGERYDAALCLGASFIWNDLPETLAALTPAVHSSGFVVVGEPYWRTWPFPDDLEPEGDYVTLRETLERFEAVGLRSVALIDASRDDWDRYETLHWLTGEAWLSANPDDPDAEGIRAELQRDRERYLRWYRDLLGWAIFVGRKP